MKYNSNFTKGLLDLSRNELSLETSILTGHGELRYHLKLMKLGDWNTLRFCNQATEQQLQQATNY